jgi:hypothetical protein
MKRLVLQWLVQCSWPVVNKLDCVICLDAYSYIFAVWY